MLVLNHRILVYLEAIFPWFYFFVWLLLLPVFPISWFVRGVSNFLVFISLCSEAAYYPIDSLKGLVDSESMLASLKPVITAKESFCFLKPWLSICDPSGLFISTYCVRFDSQECTPIFLSLAIFEVMTVWFSLCQQLILIILFTQQLTMQVFPSVCQSFLLLPFCRFVSIAPMWTFCHAISF